MFEFVFQFSKQEQLTRVEFLSERNRKNIAHGKIVAKYVILFEIAFIIIAILSERKSPVLGFDYSFYKNMYVLLIFLNALFYYFITRFDVENHNIAYHKKYYMLTLIYGLLFVLWGMTVTLADQALYSNMNAYFINLIALSSFFYLDAKHTLGIFGLTSAVFFILLPQFQFDPEILTGHFVNGSVIIVFTWLASSIMYSNFCKNFINKQLLYSQIEINSEINKELQEAVTKLEAMVLEDALTGLPNRRGLEQFIHNVDNAHLTSALSLSVIMIDIDFFKAYNDLFGHVKGDEALKRIGGLLKDQIHSLNDYVIRYGGEEFLYISIAKGSKEVLEFAENLRTAVMNLGISHPKSECAKVITISMGVITTVIGDSDYIYKQIEKADQALYKAKKLGKNKYFHMI